MSPSLLHHLAVVLPSPRAVPWHAHTSLRPTWHPGATERGKERERERRKRSEPYSHGPASCFIAVAVAAAAAGDVGDACPSLGAARPPVRPRLGRVCNLGPAARDGRPPPPQRLSEQRATATAPSLRTSRGRPPVRPTDRPTVSVPFSSSPLHRTRG